jgi:transcriptional regulator with XRE-family HTH domain
MTYGEKIVKMRKENNLTQEQLAELLSVSRQAVSKWESCVSFPETEKLIKMSKLFSCSLDYILNDEIENKGIKNKETEYKETEYKDINQTQVNVTAKENYILGIALTLLSFPPISGFIVGVFSLLHQKRTIQNRKMMILSIIGIIISLVLTTIMIIGFVLEL